MNRTMTVTFRASRVLIGACVVAILGVSRPPRLSAQEPETGAVEEATPVEMGGSTPELVTLNVQNADITQVLHAFSRQTGKSVVIGPDVTGEVTMRLTDIPWDDALDVILKPYGYGYRTVGETIVVNRLEKMVTAEAIEPIVARVFALKYLDASDVKEVVESQLSPRGHMSVLTVRGQKGWKFEASGTSRRSQQGGVASIGKRERIEEEKGAQVRSKTLVVADIESVIEKVAAILEEVDQMPGQVLIEARFLEVNADRLQDLGVEFGTGATGAEGPGVQANPYEAGGAVYGVGAQQISGGVQPQNFPPEAAIGSTHPFDSGLSFVFQRLTETQFQILLHAVQEDLSANILSAPRILTLNNQEATIIVGTKFPIIESDVTGDRAIVSTSLEYYEDIGIQLNVVPQICDNEFISMIIHPAVTDQVGTQAGRTGTESDIPLTEFPVLSTREVETQIMVKSGQTIVIGGLLTDQETVSEIKVPILGDLPLLGYLFRRETHNREKVDLLIFLTATVTGGNGGPVEAVPVAELESMPAEAAADEAAVPAEGATMNPETAHAAAAPLSEQEGAEEEGGGGAQMAEPVAESAAEAIEAAEDAMKAQAEKIAEAERRARAEARRQAQEARKAEQARKAAEATRVEAERKAQAAAAREEAEKAKAEAEKIAEAERRARAKRDAIANQAAESAPEAAEGTASEDIPEDAPEDK